MRRSLFLMFFGIAMCLCAMTSAAQAQAARTWVSGTGDDVNPCSRTAPCKTFPGAYSKTAAGGEIDALDPGGFGVISISKAITIDGGGVLASILSSGTYGVRVNAGANDQVTLRNIRINGVSQYTQPGTSGIIFISGRTLNVENCVLQNFTQFGIDFEPLVASDLNVQDTAIENATGVGLMISTTSSTGGVNRAIVRRTRITGGGSHGVQVGTNSRVGLYSVTSSRNGIGGTGDGLLADGSNSNVSVDDGLFSNNGSNGIHARNTNNVTVSNTTIEDNLGQGTFSDGGFIFTGLNNRVRNNSGGPGAWSGQIPLT